MNAHPPPPELPGRLLLAAPSLRGGPFHKSVILLGDHSGDEGAFGLVLNQPTGRKVGDLLNDPEFAALSKLEVHLGGPVSRDQLTFAALWEQNSQFGFALRISAEEAVAYLNQPGTLVRAYAGYSGWSKNQLEDELETQSWTVVEPTRSLPTLSHDITLWKALMRSHSPYHRILADAPDEVLAN